MRICLKMGVGLLVLWVIRRVAGLALALGTFSTVVLAEASIDPTAKQNPTSLSMYA